MADTLEGLQQRRNSAKELAAVVRTMKAMAASNIDQYETAVEALKAYYQTVMLGIKACRLPQTYSPRSGTGQSRRRPSQAPWCLDLTRGW